MFSTVLRTFCYIESFALGSLIQHWNFERLRVKRPLIDLVKSSGISIRCNAVPASDGCRSAPLMFFKLDSGHLIGFN